MKKFATLLIALCLISIALAEDSIQITSPVGEIIADTIEFQLPDLTVTCSGMCNGKISTYFVLSLSITETNKKEHSCYITESQKSCIVSPTFKLFRWSKWEPTILIKAVSESSMEQPSVETKSGKITIIRKPGTLVGEVKKIGEQAEVTFTCQEALCMGTKLSMTGSQEEFDCKDLDKNSPPCTAMFSIPSTLTGQIYGTARTVIPLNGTFQTSNFFRIGGEVIEDPEPQEQPTEQLETPTETGEQDDETQPIISEETGILESIWNWILSLFGV
jgi:hypothetical protein